MRGFSAVVIAGGGPTGLMLAGELTLAGVDVAIVERRASQELDGSRAGGLLPRTIEVLDQRGIAERFIADGRAIPVHGFSGIPLDLSDLPTRHGYALGLWQRDFERILAAWVSELGVSIVREREVIGFAQDDFCVDVEAARSACSPCCTMPGRCCSTSVSPAVPTSRPGRTGSN
jgi:2-polyprenyl-6-methoxyphenol hydroxylase-like FAD-dependent oxidoreductase